MNQPSADKRNSIWHDFLVAWPVSRVKSMTLKEYTQAGSRDTFTYWIEGGTQDLGSIWGGSAFKFGIYHMNPHRTDKQYEAGSMHKSDAEYAWYAKIGDTRDEAFRITKQRILEVIEAVQSNRLENIGPIGLGRAIKWKIASLYQNRRELPVVPIFNKPALKFILGVSDSRVSMAELQRLAKKKRGDGPFWDFYDEFLKKWADQKDSEEEDHESPDGDESEAGEDDQVPNSDSGVTRYWVYSAGKGGEFWNKFHAEGIMAIGWDYLGDLKQYSTKEMVAQAMRDHEKDQDASKKNNSNSCFAFGHQMKPGDVVFAKIGMNRIVGKGVITSDYEFMPTRDSFKHVRKVDWQLKGDWPLSNDNRIPLKTITEMTRYPDVVQHLLSLVSNEMTLDDKKVEYHVGNSISELASSPKYSIEDLRSETGYETEKIHAWLRTIERKKQVVFFGPPGTGKTFIAERLARNLVSETDGFCDCIQFHPSYSYEEFMQGIRPESDKNGNLKFDLKSGRFMEFCSKARARKGPCVLIIDELNRANLSRVFGELMYLLEYRNKEMFLAGGMKFSIPENVRIIATMNTADRSIALVDFALRRRFAFLELAPEYEILRNYHKSFDFDAGPLINLLHAVNHKIDDKNFHLGISFFMSKTLKQELEEIWRLEIETYLEEYFFGQPNSVSDFTWEKVKDKILI